METGRVLDKEKSGRSRTPSVLGPDGGSLPYFHIFSYYDSKVLL